MICLLLISVPLSSPSPLPLLPPSPSPLPTPPSPLTPHPTPLFQGAAFGFSSIASIAREQLTPHLPSLVPRLYRYKYDPNPKIQLAMSSIWSAVVSDSKTAVSERGREGTDEGKREWEAVGGRRRRRGRGIRVQRYSWP